MLKRVLLAIVGVVGTVAGLYFIWLVAEHGGSVMAMCEAVIVAVSGLYALRVTFANSSP
jgi:hypothetical protein